MTCDKCVALEDEMKRALTGVLKNIVSGRICCEFFDKARTTHKDVYKAVKHMHPKNVAAVKEGPLQRLRSFAIARGKFLDFKELDGAALGAGLADDDLKMLKNAATLMATKQGDLQGSAMKGAFAAYVCRCMRLLQNKSLRKMTYDQAFRDYAWAKYLFGKAPYHFDRANLFQGAIMSESTMKRDTRQQKQAFDFLDHSRDNIFQIARHAFSVLQEARVAQAIVVGDEITTLPTMRFEPQFNAYIGGVMRHAKVRPESMEQAAVDYTQTLASKCKIVGLVGLGDAPLMVLAMRPGGADAGEEAELNDMISHVVLQARWRVGPDDGQGPD